MKRLGIFTAATGAVVVAMAAALPAAAGPEGGVSVSVSPGSVSVGDGFAVTVTGCTSGQQLQVQIDPAGVISSASCYGSPGFASASFIADGALAQVGSYEVVVLETAREIGRSSVEVVAAAPDASADDTVPSTEPDKRVTKADATAADIAPAPQAQDPAAEPAAPPAPAADPAQSDPAAEPPPTDPAAEPASADPAAEPAPAADDAPAANADPAASPAAPAPSAAEAQAGGNPDSAADTSPSSAAGTATSDDAADDGTATDGLADTGPEQTGLIVVMAGLALLAGFGLRTLARRRLD